jgi:protein tyrosine phosphatase (PTP) superfamily phosphohydrolase (DUF442 family)
MLEEIKAFQRLSDRIATSGMPQPAHFSELAREGFRLVINLALPTSDNALPNEGELVSLQGMTYIHIPVKFESPQNKEYEMFAQILDLFPANKVFVHCAANMRVSAFMFLYRLERGTPRGQAEADMKKIWDPNPVWREFLNSRLKALRQPELS